MIEKLLCFKNWLFGLKIGSVAIVIWYIIKIIICFFTGVCLL
jgi:hypothetical protein